MKELLARHGHYPNRQKKYRCLSPDHPDVHPSAAIFVARDGDERLHCFPCGWDGDKLDVARALGEPVELRGSEPGTVRQQEHRPDERTLAFAHLALERHEFPFEWEVAKLLGSLSPVQARVQVVRNFYYLREHGDIGLMLLTADFLRESPAGLR